jgi:hypothetical protein
MTEPRLDAIQRDQLQRMHFTHVIVIAKDVSVQVVGSVQSAFSHGQDAKAECNRLCEMYAELEAARTGQRIEDSFEVVAL